MPKSRFRICTHHAQNGFKLRVLVDAFQAIAIGHAKAVPIIHNRRCVAAVDLARHVLGHRAVEGSAHRAIVHGAAAHVAAHAAIHALQARSHRGDAGAETSAVVFLAHAVDIGPEALFQPADLAENLFAALHFLFPIACGCDIGQLVDQGAGGVDKFAEGWRSPVGYQCLVKSNYVRFGAWGREGGAE